MSLSSSSIQSLTHSPKSVGSRFDGDSNSIEKNFQNSFCGDCVEYLGHRTCARGANLLAMSFVQEKIKVCDCFF